MQGTPDQLSNLPWEGIKTAMQICMAIGIGYIASKMKKVDKLENIIIGVDGQNGLRSDVKALKKDVAALNKRNVALDAVQEAERDQYEGPDKRHQPRRIIDAVKDSLLDNT